jgi:hypothetical protein
VFAIKATAPLNPSQYFRPSHSNIMPVQSVMCFRPSRLRTIGIAEHCVASDAPLPANTGLLWVFVTNRTNRLSKKLCILSEWTTKSMGLTRELPEPEREVM